MIHEGKIYIGQIPCLKITTDEDLKGIVIFYHGWTSTKELQSLRGHILAAYGYDVIIPEAINHGERGLIDYEENPKAYYHFWNTIFTNVFEARHVIEYCKDWHKDLPIAVMGHSMGGFSAIGIATWSDEIVTAVAMNGSGWWDESERLFRTGLFLGPMDFLPWIQDTIRKLDPYTHADALNGRSLLALTAGDDDTVNNRAQTLYMEELGRHTNVESHYIIYPGLRHFVTTNMMGDGVAWLDSHMSAD